MTGFHPCLDLYKKALLEDFMRYIEKSPVCLKKLDFLVKSSLTCALNITDCIDKQAHIQWVADNWTTGHTQFIVASLYARVGNKSLSAVRWEEWMDGYKVARLSMQEARLQHGA